MKNLQGNMGNQAVPAKPDEILPQDSSLLRKGLRNVEGRGNIHAADTDGSADGCRAVVGDAMDTRIPDLGNQAPAPQLGDHAAGATGALSVLPLVSRRVRVKLPLLPLSMTVLESPSGRRASALLGQVSRTIQEVQRPLLTPDECLRMPGPIKNASGDIDEAGDMVVYVAGYPTIYGKQPLYFKDPIFQARAAIPAPTDSDKLMHVDDVPAGEGITL
jgi:hypothetical protein